MCDNEVTDNELEFVIKYENQNISLKLQQCDTVWDLRVEIFEKLSIPPFEQNITGWSTPPDGNDDILGKCCQVGRNSLTVEYLNKMESEPNFGELESTAAIEFIEYFSNNFDDRGILFHVCRLEDAIAEACFTSLENRKILLLYLHNKSDKFAKIFGENLQRSEVKEIINSKYFLLGWDLENETYHPALVRALNYRAELSSLVHLVESKICAALLIVPIKNSFTLFSCMRSKVSKKDFLETLKKADEFLRTENDIEKELENVEQSANDIGSATYQQIMLDLLGDRDYDRFDYFEFDLLKDKIGYALYGPPEQETGYNDKQKKKIKSLFEKIVEENNAFAKWKDHIIMSFIYNCTEPLPSEKQKRAKKYPDYNPATDLAPTPLFILRKCKDSPQPCRVIIDETGRVYRTWQSYLTHNKLPTCEMCLPLDGRYQADEAGRVILERHLSPACGIDHKILRGMDVANTATGLVSGGIVIAAIIPTVTVAPVALVVAGAAGLGVGLYSLGRSAYTLYDRKTHKESLSFANSEARGAYLNIVAGSLGFVGAGASVAVSQLAARGVNVGQGATAALNVLNVANIGASGINMVNSSYDVFDQWWNENQTPSLLTIVQLSSSILFFGHAVYNYTSVAAVVDESQARTLREYHDSLRSNRHKKTFSKLLKETIRQNEGNAIKGRAEVIKTINRIQNPDEAFATLTRLNKRLNENNIRFAAQGGEINLNGMKIDLSLLGSMESQEVASFLKTLPETPEPSQPQVTAMATKLQSTFSRININNISAIAAPLSKLFQNSDESIQDKLLNAVEAILEKLLQDFPGCFRELDKIFPGVDKVMRLTNMVAGYFQKLIDELEKQYQLWLETKDPGFEKPIFVEVALDGSRRFLKFFEHVSGVYFSGAVLTAKGLRELLEYFYTWFAKQELAFEEYRERKRQRVVHSSSPTRRAKCPDCGGVYYR